MSAIPGPGELTPAFVGACLRDAGHAQADVRALRGERIGTGQIGQVHRFTLEYAGEPGDAPRTLVAKFPSDDPRSRETGVRLRSFVKEVSFYRDLQPRLSIRTPRCYFAAIEGEGPEHLLLLEDLAPAVQGDQLAGCDAAVARAAVLQLVGLHAPTWRDAGLADLAWLGAPSDESVAFGRALYRAQLAPFLDRYRAHLADDEAALIERVADSSGPPFERLGEVFSVVHVDYRLDNLLIDASADPPTVAAVDWQSLTLGNPLSDVAYFLGAGLLPDARRALEREIVADYHRRLVAAGVAGYDAARCWEDYRRGVFSGLAVSVVAAPIVARTERGDAMFTAMARRHARHALDLGCEELL